MCNISETGMYLIDFALSENQSQLEINVGYYIKDYTKFVSVENVLGSILILKLFRAGFRDIREQTCDMAIERDHHSSHPSIQYGIFFPKYGSCHLNFTCLL